MILKTSSFVVGVAIHVLANVGFFWLRRNRHALSPTRFVKQLYLAEVFKCILYSFALIGVFSYLKTNIEPLFLFGGLVMGAIMIPLAWCVKGFFET